VYYTNGLGVEHFVVHGWIQQTTSVRVAVEEKGKERVRNSGERTLQADNFAAG
jgi:hypothetical protein